MRPSHLLSLLAAPCIAFVFILSSMSHPVSLALCPSVRPTGSGLAALSPSSPAAAAANATVAFAFSVGNDDVDEDEVIRSVFLFH